jgi:uncharacterized protein (DUF952 family)
MSEVVFHIARKRDWNAAEADGEYRVSTLGRSLGEVGFIHCSASRDQVLAVASAFYANVPDSLLLLTVDLERVGSEVRFEHAGEAPEPFPHIYGPIPISSVASVTDLARDASGAFIWPYRG